MKQAPWLVLIPALLACQEEVVVPVYQAVAVAVRDISVSAQAAGVIEPDTTVEVKSKASGEILDIRVQTGDRVDRGTLMVRIDQRVPRNSLLQSEASLEVAHARLANAEAQKRRSDELYETQSITQAEYEDTRLVYANAKANLVQAEVAVENDRIRMDDTDIRAPISGTIIAKNVERGQVISSPTSDVAGGTVLLTMADLSLVQVRTLVDETDIGKIRPGLHATVSVASYPNQPFEGQVLKIEPMAETQQNVTMFPVLIRIPNTDGLLRPGMNAEVEISIGRREGVLAVPNAALRTDRDVGSAAEVLGLTLEAVQTQLARSPEVPGQQASSLPAAEASDRETLTLRNGRTVELPPGVPAERARAIMNKRRSGEPLTEDEQEIGRQIFEAFRGGRDGEPGRAAVSEQRGSELQTADYVVFVLRDGTPTAVRIKTGLTDLDYSEVLAGLTAADSVLVLRNIAQQAS